MIVVAMPKATITIIMRLLMMMMAMMILMTATMSRFLELAIYS